MALGLFFPKRFREASLRRQLSPGTVIKLVARMDDERDHEKRFVVLEVDQKTITCVINSEVGPFLRARPELLRCQVLMPAEQHKFMDHDSHIDCSRTRSFATNEVLKQLGEKPEWVLGRIASPLRDVIVGAIKISPTISPADCNMICNGFGAIDP